MEALTIGTRVTVVMIHDPRAIVIGFPHPHS